MPFYDLAKEERKQKYDTILNVILSDLEQNESAAIRQLFGDEDTYIRKAAYLSIGKLFLSQPKLHGNILKMLTTLMENESPKVRQTVINSCGEIAMIDFGPVQHLFEIGMNDSHHFVKNAVTGSLKKAGNKNPVPVIKFIKNNIQNNSPEIRRILAHGLELRGRTHPEEIMPVLKLLQFEKHARVRPMLIHIVGQISYKKGCLGKVVAELLTWEDKKLAEDCFKEIIKQHDHINNHFKTVETLSPLECEEYIKKQKC
jgi:vesicle coat complex subunit